MATKRETAGPTNWTFGSHKYATEEEMMMGANLRKQLGPEYISSRPGPGGGKVYYLEGWKSTQLANEIFGFNGWSHSIVDITLDYVDKNEGKISLGISAVVRVTLKDGTYHEDIGYAFAENQRNQGQAFEKAKKEAVTDATKRALRAFGNSLGNCLYDKDYVKKIGRMSAVPSLPLNTDDLYRRPEFAQHCKKEPVTQAPIMQNLPSCPNVIAPHHPASAPGVGNTLSTAPAPGLSAQSMLEEARSIAASLDTTSTSPLNQAAKGNQQNNMHQNPHNNSYNSWERSNYNRSGHDRVPPNIPSSVANHTDPSRILGVPQVDPKSSSPQYNSRGSDGAFEGRASLPPQQHSSANTGSGPPHKQFSTPSPQNMMNGSHQQNYRPNSNLRPNENKGQAQSNAPMNSTYMQGHGNAMQERSNYNNQMLSGKQGGSFNDASRSAAAVPQALAPTTKQSPQGIKRPLEQQRSDYLGAGKQHGLAEGSPHLSAMRAPSIDANDKGQNNAQNYQYTNPIVKRPRGDIPGFN